MSSNADEVLALASQAKNFIPADADRRPSVFLSLAPATSSSYPQKKPSVAAPAPVTDTAAADATTAAAIDPKQRRSSSTSSSTSNSAATPGLRFLKLGPVHWGEHLDDHQQDWHEVVVE